MRAPTTRERPVFPRFAYLRLGGTIVAYAVEHGRGIEIEKGLRLYKGPI
jgi:hypothetical protein